jgi:hypothetical protein
MKLNPDAWNMLTEPEKTALTLQHGMQKSSWQSGEIMDRSHYKYLEILYRAQQFLKMFTEHVELFDCLIPEYVNGSKMVITYFKLCIEQRLKPMDALEKLRETKSNGRVIKAILNEKIIETLETWEASESAYDNTCHQLVKEFDRWNNFRILPKQIQEPSAFKRRIKNTYKKQIKITSTINTLSLDKLIKMYKTKAAGDYAWWPLIYNKEPMVVPIKLNQQSEKIFNSLSFYLYKSKPDAVSYIEAISEYTSKKKKACTDGLDFWPVYREVIKKAKNYDHIQKITPTRRFLQVALSKLEYL